MPYFVVHALDRPDMAVARQENRPAHRARLRDHSHPVKVHIGGPLLDGRGAMCGTMLVIEAETEGNVAGFLDGDPYSKAGIYDEVTIHQYNWGIGRPEVADG